MTDTSRDMTPETFKAIRQHLGVTQLIMGNLIVRNEGIVSRMEQGKTKIPPAIEYVLNWKCYEMGRLSLSEALDKTKSLENKLGIENAVSE